MLGCRGLGVCLEKKQKNHCFLSNNMSILQNLGAIREQNSFVTMFCPL